MLMRSAGLMSTDTAIVAAEKAKELEFDAKKKHPVPSNPYVAKRMCVRV